MQFLIDKHTYYAPSNLFGAYFLEIKTKKLNALNILKFN